MVEPLSLLAGAITTYDELVIPELLAELTRYSLIRLETDDRYSIHRLVQEFLRDGLTLAQRQQWLDRTVDALNATFPNPEIQNWWLCARLMEQVQSIDFQQATETFDLARLSNRIGYFLDEQGCYREAESFYQKALKITRSQLGADHPDTAGSLNNLALLYQSQGRYGETEPLYQRAISIWLNQLGENHPNTQRGCQNFVYFLQQVMASGRTADLSAHPITQGILAQLQSE